MKSVRIFKPTELKIPSNVVECNELPCIDCAYKMVLNDDACQQRKLLKLIA